MYKGRCNIYEYKTITDKKTHITKEQEEIVYKDVPCKLSFKSINSVDNSSGVGKVTQTIKLFIAPEIEIKAGSKIEVTQNNKTNYYSRSGEPAIYSNHQELQLELFKKYTIKKDRS